MTTVVKSCLEVKVLVSLSPKCPLQVSQMMGHLFACHQSLVFPKTASKKKCMDLYSCL